MENKRLNIIYHFRVRGTGAEGVHIAGIVNGFRSMGHNVKLVSPTGVDPTKPACYANPPTEKSNPITKLLHKMADFLPQPFFELMEIAYNLFGIIRLSRAIKRSGKTDLIYERYAFFNFSGVLISKVKKIPLIIEVNELSGLKRVRGQYFVRTCSLIEKHILRQARLVVVVSQFLNESVHERTHPKRVKVITVPNGVPEDWKEKRVSPEVISSLRKQHNLGNKKVVCFIGGLVEWHNFGLLLEAFKRVIDKVDRSLLMLVGEGPMREYISKKAKQLEIIRKLLLIGSVPHDQIPVYLKASDVLVIPEVNEFRSPIKLFEYMAAGRAIIAPRRPAIEAVISDGVEGLMFKPGDPQSFGSAIIKIIENDVLAAKLGENAKKRVFRDYTWEQHSKVILDEFFDVRRGC